WPQATSATPAESPNGPPMRPRLLSQWWAQLVGGINIEPTLRKDRRSASSGLIASVESRLLRAFRYRCGTGEIARNYGVSSAALDEPVAKIVQYGEPMLSVSAIRSRERLRLYLKMYPLDLD